MRVAELFASQIVPRVRRWAAPPVFADPVKTRMAAQTNALLLVTVGLWILIVTLMAVFRIGHRTDSLIALVASVVLLIARGLIRRGHTAWAAILGIGVAWAVPTAFLYNLGTLNSVHLCGYIVAVMVAAWFGGPRAGTATSLLSAATVLVLAFAKAENLLPPVTRLAPLTMAISAAGYLGVASVLLLLARTHYVMALRNAQDEIAERQRAEAALRDLNAVLEQRVAERTKALREREERQRLILDHLSVGVVLADIAGTPFYLNSRFTELFGYTLAQLSTLADWWPLAHPEPAYREQVAEEWSRRLVEVPETGGEARPLEVTIACSDGSEKQVRITARVIGDLLFVTFIDVTEQKAAEDALRLSENRYRDLYQNAPVAYFSVGPDARIRRCNRQAAQLLGYTIEQLEGRPVFDLYADTLHGKPQARQVFQRFLAGVPVADAELQMVRADGTPIWVSLSVTAILDAAGKVVESRSAVIDVTERKAAERKLLESEERLELALEAANAGAWEWDPAANKVIWSDGNYRVLGYEPRAVEASYENWLAVVHPDDRAAAEAAVAQAVAAHSPLDIEFRAVWPDGHVRWLRDLGRFLDDQAAPPARMIGLQLDITRDKELMAALHTSEERYRMLLAMSPDGISVADNTGRLLACNEQCARLHGYDHSSEMVGRQAGEFYTSESFGSLFGRAAAVLRSGQDVACDIEAAALRRDGSTMEVECSIARVPWPDAPSGEAFVTSFRDVTQRNEMLAELARHRNHLEELAQERTAALQRSEASLRAAERIARMGSWERDLITNELYLSEGLYRILGLSPEMSPDAAFRAAWEAVHPDDVVAARAAFARTTSSGMPLNLTFRLVRPSGDLLVLHVMAEVLCDEAGQPQRMRATAQDITEQAAAQAALQRSQASLAEAERIAHLGSWELTLANGELRLSDELRRLFGFGLETSPLTLADLDEAMHPADRDAVKAARERALQSDRTYSNQYRIVRPDGETRVVYVQGEIHRDAKGRATHAFGTAQDITERARTLEELDQRVRELSSLQALSDEISLSFSREELIENVLERIISAAGLDVAKVFLLREGQLHVVGIRTREAVPVMLDRTCALGECLCGLSARDGQLRVTGDVGTDPRCTSDNCKTQGLRSLAALPLRSGDTVIGVLVLGSLLPDALDARLTFLQAVADQIAIGLQNALLHQEIQERAAALEETVAERTRELQTERDRTQAILETVGESVVVTDLDGQLLFVNPATAALTGHARDQDLGTPIWHGWTLPARAEAWPEAQAALRSGQAWNGEINGQRRDGTAYTAALTGTPLYDANEPSGPAGVVWAQRDITALKEAARLKDQFVSNVSHELRTPISIISLGCDNLVAAQGLLDEGERMEIIRDIQEQAHRLSQLVADTLQIAQIDAGRVPAERRLVDLAGLVREEAECLRPLTERRDQRLSVSADAGVQVLGNETQLRQVVRNLLDNAIKYTLAGRRISCACGVRPCTPGLIPDADTPGAEACAVMEVTDEGIGISAEDLPYLFERFFRVNNEDQTSGTGLGLPIARELVRLHGGWITVASTPGQGSTFTVSLPLAEAAGREAGGLPGPVPC